MRATQNTPLKRGVNKRATNHSNLNETLLTPETLPISMAQLTSFRLEPETKKPETISDLSPDKSFCAAPEQTFASDEEDDDSLQNHDPILRYVVSEDVDE